MHMRSLAIILAALAVSACGTAGQGGLDSDIPYVENALRLEFSFGDGDLPEEYLLAEPSGLAVRDSGDILIADEHHIKIYDAQGTPRDRFGGQGQGPGEFQESRPILLGPRGFLAAESGFSQFNLYGPDLTYLGRYKGGDNEDLRHYIREQGLTFSFVVSLYPLGESKRIVVLFGRNRELPGKFPVFRYLVYSDGSSLRELVKYHSLATVLNDRGGSTGSAYLGGFHWGGVAGNRIVHAQTHQSSQDYGSPSYVLNILDLESGSSAAIEVGYEPVVLPDSLRELKTQHFRSIGLTVEPPPELQALLNETRYLPAFRALRTDGDLVFLFKFNPINEELEQSIAEAERNGGEIPEGIYARFEPHQVDIVSAASGRLIARAEFPCIPDVIKDGRAYRLSQRADAFPKVECYRLDPAVYEKNRNPQ